MSNSTSMVDRTSDKGIDSLMNEGIDPLEIKPLTLKKYIIRIINSYHICILYISHKAYSFAGAEEDDGKGVGREEAAGTHRPRALPTAWAALRVRFASRA